MTMRQASLMSVQHVHLVVVHGHGAGGHGLGEEAIQGRGGGVVHSGADGGRWRRIVALSALWVGLLYDDAALGAAWRIGPDRDGPLYEGLGLTFAEPDAAA